MNSVKYNFFEKNKVSVKVSGKVYDPQAFISTTVTFSLLTRFFLNSITPPPFTKVGERQFSKCNNGTGYLGCLIK